ncbi:MAG TPA: peptidyl-prolyl cis-trans isomerase [Candidatus Acidoferrum sp.]|nr:peptidyl-prolyl cis-trans isomerase [Candidatus Acidoferrum sp.]
MAVAKDSRKTGMRILLGVVVLLLGGSMLLYLVPQTPGTGEASSTDIVAKVGDQTVSASEIRQQFAEIQQRNQIPKQLESLYARQILNQLIFQKEMEYEAKRLGIRVSDQERAARIRQFLPTAYNGDTFVGMDRYASEVQARFQLSVPVFEELIRQGLLQDKFRKLVTDGVSVGPSELQDEFKYRNEKVKLDYAFIKPEDLEAKIAPDEAEIKAAYEKNRSRYQVPEKRVARYGLIDLTQLRQTAQISDDELKAQYQQNIQQYQVPNRVHVEHILLMTVSKTDAEVEEIRQKAEDVLQQAKKGAKFEDLAKKYSEDPGTKDKGGDLGWITQGQTVAEFEKTAFGLDKGKISDLVKTQYGFHIIKVLEKETAHTKPFDEVKDSIKVPLLLAKTDKLASDEADQLSATIRRSNKISLDDLAKQFHLSLGETRPVTATDPILELSNSKEAKEAIFRFRQDELSLPIRTDRGYLVLSVKQIQPAHPGSLEEVRDKIVTELKQQKSSELARVKAEDLAKRVKAGEKFDAAAKSLGLESKTSDLFARNGSISGAVSGKQVAAAFQLKPGDVGAPLNLGANWFVYRVAEKQEPNPADFEKQKKELTEQVLQTKRNLAFEAFRTSLEARLRQEGKLQIMSDKLKGFGDLS